MKNKLEILFLTGRIGELDDPEEAISLLKSAAVQDPELLFITLAKHPDSPIVILAVAAFLGNGQEDHFSAIVKNDLFEIIIDHEIDDLILLVELLKSKIFGRGFGSRSQKLLRKVLEAWTITDLKNQIVANHQAVRDLICLIHPRFSDTERSRLIKDLFRENINN